MMEIPTTVDTILSVTLRPQTGERLCWAAVAEALANFYQPGSPITQEWLVDALLPKHNPDQILDVRKAFELTGNLKAYLKHPLSMAEIISELQQGCPIAACMRYFIGWHLVLIDGVAADGQLYINDPLYGRSRMSLETFTQSYREHYQWTHTYLSHAGLLSRTNDRDSLTEDR